MESPNDLSANASSLSSASEVLRRSSAPHLSQAEQPGMSSGLHNSSDASSSANSSISSSGSMRVRIKAKYLKERKSPFETDGVSSTPYLPPALPGNLPAGYDVQRDVADVQRHTHTKTLTSTQTNDDGALAGRVMGSMESHRGDRQEEVLGVRTPSSAGRRTSEHRIQPQPTNSHDHGDHSPTSVDRSFTVPSLTHPSTSTLSTVSNNQTKSSGVLRQGAPTSSSLPFQGAMHGQGMDVRVTQFSKGQRQQVMRDQLLKRSENAKPTKRYYQPKLIASSKPSAPKPEETSKAQSDASAMATATAAAAAAVAATVPLLKTQSDMESKMNQIMEKLSVLEHAGHGPPPPPPWVYPVGQGWGGGGYDARHELGEMTQRRLGELKELQRQQQEMQNELRALSQRTASKGQKETNGLLPQNSHTFSDHLKPPQASLITQKDSRSENEFLVKEQDKESRDQIEGQPGTDPKTSSGSPRLKTLLNERSQPGIDPKTSSVQKEPSKHSEKHVKYTPVVTLHHLPPRPLSSDGQKGSSTGQQQGSEHHGTQTSPLDTPAPRRHAPRPLSKEARATGISQLGRGLLEEILSSHDEDERLRDLRQRVNPAPVSTLNVNSSNARYVTLQV